MPACDASVRAFVGFTLGVARCRPSRVVVAYFRPACGGRDQLLEVPSVRGGSRGCSLWALLTSVITCASDQPRAIVERLRCTHLSEGACCLVGLGDAVSNCSAVRCCAVGLQARCVSESEVYRWSAACWSPIRPVLKHGPRS